MGTSAYQFQREFLDPNYTKVTSMVAKTLDTSIAFLLGFTDSDEKILTCYFEMIFTKTSSTTLLAKKYNLDPNYMMNRINQLGSRIRIEPELKEKYKKLLRAFELD
ncbi:hypothetical protein [Aquimarina sp. 2201CG14-23]|uniref:hypothetical protein n=1 Tax=Aquimarina mycalae TaxID=3040073 RepID=UPI0024780475|nr:hypothetical protein [Aquimarina sp. 2201CG14-23]MDH7444656.1 hypothetical protein [Aquimarina sp. 2201CG14-23]